jgi:hypothetical protein
VSQLLALSKTDVALLEASDIITAYIEEYGKDYIKPAYDASSGRIPKDLRPEIPKATISEQSIYDHLLFTFFEYSTTKYVVSGRTLAAYHPGILFDCCGPGCCGTRHDSARAKTNPTTLHDGPRIIVRDSALPMAMVAQAVANIKKDPRKWFEIRDKVVDDLRARCVQRHGSIPKPETFEGVVCAVGQSMGWSWNGWTNDN